MPRSTRHRLYPEPGAWVLDNIARLPPIQPPNTPVRRQLSTREVADEIEYHGLGVCIYSYIFAKCIADESLREKWIIARKALVEVVKYIDREDRKVSPKHVKKRPPTKKINLGEEL